MHEYPILINITLSVAAALVGGYLARLLKLPTMVGYLLAGIVISPFTPGFIGDLTTIQQLAELGVIFLLFGVGLHFSLRDLWAVRAIAIPGTLIQLGIITAFGVLLTRFWGWSLPAGILLGVAVAIASTVVMIRNLMDQGLLNTTAGQIAMGWLVLEDLITVLILVLLPTLTANAGEPVWQSAGLALLKTGAFAALMLIAGTRIVPWFLTRMAYLRSRELFIVAIVVITVGIALAASALFGVSLALGAFMAGVVVSESALSHQVEVEVLPFRETFGVLFFVSVGMLVNPLYLLSHAGEVLALVALIIGGKFLITLLLGLIFPQSAGTMLIVAAGRAQIGEFSFILGQTGVALGLLTQEQYSLILAGAIISITINPFVFRALPWIETRLRAFPALWSLLDRQQPLSLQTQLAETLHEHVVVVGYGRVGHHIVQVLSHLEVPRLVIDLDVSRIIELDGQGVPTLYGDAAESEILTHAHVERAQAVVVTVPDEASAFIIVAKVRKLAPQVTIIVRAATQDGVHRLFELGANEVIHPELEGGLNIVRQTLTHLGYAENETQQYISAVRHDHYDLTASTLAEQYTLAQLHKKSCTLVAEARDEGVPEAKTEDLV
ncbi:sodium:proton exchanger [Ktedonosporobacter rubrisoli]|uniref:Sodium:proton exchanger n=1 Tax=Ktedonosporobacter rubrisoli TaxID=2509675 RepID=A0A4P6JIP0_KTERU|nr:cation:proton antiporter [Ktedonosporobacter rubrisoli]QBD74516.1 sodium:proton exchanger [Ktedonosporobacter rubrisoli]